MQIQIDNTSDRAVYQQIIDQVKRDIALGKFIPGDKLLTVRQLAAQLVINPNTIAKAYRQLERDKIITTRPGAGTFIAQLSTNLSRSVRKKILVTQLERLAVEAVHMQIDPQTLTKWFQTTLDKFNFQQDSGARQ